MVGPQLSGNGYSVRVMLVRGLLRVGRSSCSAGSLLVVVSSSVDASSLGVVSVGASVGEVDLGPLLSVVIGGLVLVRVVVPVAVVVRRAEVAVGVVANDGSMNSVGAGVGSPIWRARNVPPATRTAINSTPSRLAPSTAAVEWCQGVCALGSARRLRSSSPPVTATPRRPIVATNV